MDTHNKVRSKEAGAKMNVIQEAEDNNEAINSAGEYMKSEFRWMKDLSQRSLVANAFAAGYISGLKTERKRERATMKLEEK